MLQCNHFRQLNLNNNTIMGIQNHTFQKPDLQLCKKNTSTNCLLYSFCCSDIQQEIIWAYLATLDPCLTRSYLYLFFPGFLRIPSHIIYLSVLSSFFSFFPSFFIRFLSFLISPHPPFYSQTKTCIRRNRSFHHLCRSFEHNHTTHP